ncbi:hypothetical protein [Vibrio sp. SCSIO 43137]|uniref:hypothetical protein n=1 Tax=Vibrio sp. SCSIO 43137 TaxID=3021011 RepID=UPI0023082121|nr:hypothetical protein [Vibrio sp. SCSIO 43137]WCE28810.1 hypothetical protein PK654_10610 [Vibrio sp. SCSIO 43137]
MTPTAFRKERISAGGRDLLGNAKAIKLSIEDALGDFIAKEACNLTLSKEY